MDHASQPLTRKALDEFKAIYQRKRGDALSDDEATAMASRLLSVVSAFLRIAARNRADSTGSNRVAFDRIGD